MGVHPNLIRRENGYYYFVMNVPKRLKPLTKHRQIWRSLRTKDEATARRRLPVEQVKYAVPMDNDIVPDDVRIDYSEIKLTAKKLNVEYFPHSDLSNFNVSQLLQAYEARESVKALKSTLNPVETVAIAGALETPPLLWDKAFKLFQELSPEKVFGVNEVEKRRKWRRFEQATEDFLKRMPTHTDVLKIEKRHVAEYRTKLIAACEEGEFKSDEANKKLMWLRIILDVVISSHYPERANAFENFKSINLEDAAKRKPFTEAEVKIARAALKKSSMKEECKAIAILGEMTGCGVRELIWMEAADISLDAPIPFISVRPNSLRRKVKKGGVRHRNIVLTGDALEVMKSFPNGFPSFQDGQGSTRMNCSMSDFFRKIVPGKGHYSYRHRLDDLLKRSGCDLGLKSAIMGHSVKGHAGYYGEGYSLENQKAALEAAWAYARKN